MQKIDTASMKGRSAFTLVEILVVIAIIAILASLILGAVVVVRNRIPATTARNDVLQLSTALQKFYSQYNFYPPNRLRLCSSRAQYAAPGLYTTAQEDAQSIAAITTMFPNINWVGIMWDTSHFNGVDNTGLNGNLDATLEGDQCLVFFLGGLPNAAGQPPQGFLKNAAYPAPSNTPTTLVPPQLAVTLANSPDRLKFMTTWDTSRIVLLRPQPPAADPTHSLNFPSYLDGFSRDLPAAPAAGKGQKQPYLYFSSMSLLKKENGYDSAPSGPVSTLTNPASPWNAATNPYLVAPYVQQAGALPKYWNPTTFQIVSAGADGLFGLGGVWPPAKNHGMDDISNFNTSVLSAPD